MRQSLENSLKSEIDPAFAKRAKLIFNSIEQSKPQKVLDAGCGRGFYVNALKFFPFIKEIHGCDINDKYLKIAKKNADDRRIKITQASLYSLPYPDGYFDCVICSEVLEHLKNDKKALEELQRVLRPKGLLLITVPNKNFPFLWDPLNWLLIKIFHTHVNKDIWWLAGIWADHQKLYSKEDIISTLQKVGLIIRESHLVIGWCWPFSHFLMYGLGKNVVERLGLLSFDRFSASDEMNKGSLLASFFALPSVYLDKAELKKVSVNILVKSQKK